jgi:hypothetical protein
MLTQTKFDDMMTMKKMTENMLLEDKTWILVIADMSRLNLEK